MCDEGIALGTREAQYQLASRLVDYMRLGEAIRILEALGDYKNSPALLKEVRAIKDFADAAEEQQKEEARLSKLRQERLEAERRRRRLRILITAALCFAVAAVILLLK